MCKYIHTFCIYMCIFTAVVHLIANEFHFYLLFSLLLLLIYLFVVVLIVFIIYNVRTLLFFTFIYEYV